MLNTVSHNGPSPDSMSQEEDQLRPRVQLPLERVGTSLGSFIGRTTNNMLSAAPVIGRAMGYINTHYSKVDNQDTLSIQKIKALQAALNSICLEFNISSTEDFESKIQSAKSEKEKIEIYKIEVETQLKNIFRCLQAQEQSVLREAVSPIHSPTLSSTESMSVGSLEHSKDDQSTNLASVSISSEINESDPEIEKLYEELRILFDILEAVCFNNFHRLEAKHWTKLEALLEELETESRIGTQPNSLD